MPLSSQFWKGHMDDPAGLTPRGSGVEYRLDCDQPGASERRYGTSHSHSSVIGVEIVDMA